MASELNNLGTFPLSFRTSLQHSISAADLCKDFVAATDECPQLKLSLSPPVRMGPLELRIEAGLFLNKDKRRDLSFFLHCASVVTGFPWEGTLEDAEFRLFWKQEEGNKRLVPVKSNVTDVSSDMAPVRIGTTGGIPNLLESSKHQMQLHLEVLLTVSVKIKSGGCVWKIPYAILSIQEQGHNADFLESKDWSDLELESKDGDKIPAHRLILAGKSEVFRTMFTTEMKEKAEGIVKLEDIGTKALKLMLKFLYTENICEELEDSEGYDMEVFLEVVDAAVKYELPLLMKLAGVGLLLRCNRKNALVIFECLRPYEVEMKEALLDLAGYIRQNIVAMAGA